MVSLFDTNPQIMKEYDMIRGQITKLNTLIQDSVFEGKLRKYDPIGTALSHLGLSLKSDKVLKNKNLELDFIAEYVNHEVLIDRKTINQIIYESVEIEKTPLQKKILEARIDSYTSYFEIIGFSPEKNTILMKDLLFEEEGNIEIIDRFLSRTPQLEGFSMFSRIVSYQNFNMNGGTVMVFEPKNKERALTEVEKRAKILSNQHPDAVYFSSFYRCYSQYGVPYTPNEFKE